MQSLASLFPTNQTNKKIAKKTIEIPINKDKLSLVKPMKLVSKKVST